MAPLPEFAIMKTDLTEEQIERGREFLKDLRANEVKAVGQMRDGNARCCLCVAYDTAKKLGAYLAPIKDDDGHPPEAIECFYGWEDVNPWLVSGTATAHNDGDGIAIRTHAEIADLFEQEFPQLKQL